MAVMVTSRKSTAMGPCSPSLRVVLLKRVGGSEMEPCTKKQTNVRTFKLGDGMRDVQQGRTTTSTRVRSTSSRNALRKLQRTRHVSHDG